MIRASEAIRVERLDSVIGSTENKNESIKNESLEDEVRTVPQSSQKIEGSARSTILSHLYKKTTEPLNPGRPLQTGAELANSSSRKSVVRQQASAAEARRDHLNPNKIEDKNSTTRPVLVKDANSSNQNQL